MADVLVVNAGSTSLKLDLVSPEEESRRIASYDQVIGDVEAVGHRIVHGGARFKAPVVIDEEVEGEIADLALIAPLHNTPALRALEEARRVLPGVPHVAVFDTAFHSTLPDEAAIYAVPRRWSEEWGIRRFGFHGLSVQWSAERVPVPRLVVCHLGGGCSVTAVLDGRSVDTSMGFSPLEGVPMAARSGSVDPGILLFLLREKFLTLEELDEALEHDSGLKALGGLESRLGFGIYTHRIAATVAAMTSALGGLDGLVFTAGVGENVPDRARRDLPAASLSRDRARRRRERVGRARCGHRDVGVGRARRRRRRARGDRGRARRTRVALTPIRGN